MREHVNVLPCQKSTRRVLQDDSTSKLRKRKAQKLRDIVHYCKCDVVTCGRLAWRSKCLSGLCTASQSLMETLVCWGLSRRDWTGKHGFAAEPLQVAEKSVKSKV